MTRGNILRVTTTLVNIVRYMLIIGLLAIGIFGLYGVLFPDRMSPALEHTTLELRDLGLSISVPLQGLASQGARQFFGLITAMGLAAMILALVTVTRLSGILRTAAEGTPFVAENAVRVRAIGFATLGWAGLKILVQASFGTFLSNHLTWPGVELNVKVDFAAETILFGLLVLVLAEVFRYGVALQQEHDLTV